LNNVDLQERRDAEFLENIALVSQRYWCIGYYFEEIIWYTSDHHAAGHAL